MSKIIFLDVDGVLNCRTTDKMAPSGYRGVEMDFIENLVRIVKKTGAEIVMTSDWKDLWDKETGEKKPDFQYLETRLSRKGLSVTDKTNDKSNSEDINSGRGEGIRQYLETHPEIENYVILDDAHYTDFRTLGFEEKGKVVYTSAQEGLDIQTADKAIRVLETAQN